MAVSETNRRRFEGIGLEHIRRELTVGNQFYIPIDAATQAEAREWVAEQDAKREQEKREVRNLEASRFNQILGWTIAGVGVAIVAAAAAVIAAWPVAREWIK